MSISQSDILNYNPDLSIYSSPSTNPIFDEDNETIGYAEVDENKSNVVSDFEAQSPSKQINDLYGLLEDIKEYKDKMEELYSNNTYFNKYLTSTDEDDKKDILYKNKNDMENGSTPLEAYNILTNIEEEINNVIQKYIECMFGKDVDIDTVQDLENAYIDKITQYETNHEYEKINYFNLYYDCQISYLLREYITKLKYICVELGYVADKPKTTEVNSLLSEMFSGSFKDLNLKQDNQLYININCCNDILTAMNNIFLTKKKVSNYFEVYSNLSLYGDGIEDIIDIKNNNINELELKLDKLIKTVLSSMISKDDILETLKKKSNYRGFFVS